MHWFIRKHVIKMSGKKLVIFALIQFTMFEVLIYHHQRFDQCAVVDANFAACVQRNAFSWDEHLHFKGKGLSAHIPAHLPKVKSKKPLNVLVVVFESLRQRSLQLYGHHRETTPNLVAFAKAHPSAFYPFEQAVSIASTTMLAVPAIMTGIGPYQDSSLLYSQPMIFEMGQQLDYRTFFLSSHTLQWYRFDTFYKNCRIDYLWNKDVSGIPYYNDLGIKDEITIEAAKKCLFQGKHPFFGVIQLNTTHFPFHVPKAYEKWNDQFSASYDNAVRYQDVLVGRLLEHLKKSKLLENTAIFFVSDHGESLMEHRNIGHAETNYTETIRIPLFAYIPPKFLSNQQKKSLHQNKKLLCSNIDIAPTILELLQLDQDPSWMNWKKNYTGFSLLATLPKNRKVISLNNNQITNFNTGLSVATNQWHFLYRMNIVPNRQEFYWWKKDIGELHNQRSKMSKKQQQEVIDLIQNYPVCERFLGIFKKEKR